MPFLTCSPECFGSRNKRLKREKYQREKVSKRYFCIDCSVEVPTDLGRSARCERCKTVRRRSLAEARKARRQMDPTDSALSWAAKPQVLPRKKLDNRLRSMYGITIETYEAMQTAQNGLCAICQQSPEGRGRGGTLVVDHCHKQGNVRALLCGRCNIAIGLLDDAADVVDRASEYLRHWDAAAVAV